MLFELARVDKLQPPQHLFYKHSIVEAVMPVCFCAVYGCFCTTELSSCDREHPALGAQCLSTGPLQKMFASSWYSLVSWGLKTPSSPSIWQANGGRIQHLSIHYCTSTAEVPDRNNLTLGRCILARGFRRFLSIRGGQAWVKLVFYTGSSHHSRPGRRASQEPRPVQPSKAHT